MKFACAFTLLCAAAVPSLAAAPARVSTGAYECWAFSSPRLLLNFRVTSDKKYTGSDGKSGEYRYDPATGAITFTSGALEGVMPKGFTSVYHENKGRPTVSFRSGRGAEASFCEKTK